MLVWHPHLGWIPRLNNTRTSGCDIHFCGEYSMYNQTLSSSMVNALRVGVIPISMVSCFKAKPYPFLLWAYPEYGYVVSWHFEPSQPHGITSGLKTNFNPSPNYLFHKPENISRRIYNSFKTLHTNITSSHVISYRTHQSLSGSQTLLPESHFENVNTNISPQNISF